MASDIDVARGLVELSEEAEALLLSTARPIVLATGENRTSRSCSRQRRTGRHAALHAFASFALRGGCAGNISNDQRQSLQRTYRLRR